MKMNFFLWSLWIPGFLLSACSNVSNESTKTEFLREDSTKTAVKSEQSIPLTTAAQLENSVLAEFYARKVISIKDDILYFNFEFDLNSDGGSVPDTYGVKLRFNFKVGEKLSFPETIEFEEEEFNEEISEGLERQTGLFYLVAATDDLLIYNSASPLRTLVLFENGVQTGELAYYFYGEEHINKENVYGVIDRAYEGGEQVIKHSRSSGLSIIE